MCLCFEIQQAAWRPWYVLQKRPQQTAQISYRITFDPATSLMLFIPTVLGHHGNFRLVLRRDSMYLQTPATDRNVNSSQIVFYKACFRLKNIWGQMYKTLCVFGGRDVHTQEHELSVTSIVTDDRKAGVTTRAS